MSELGFNVRLDADFDDAVARVTAALKQEGFGVLTEIDVRATLKQKLDVDFRPYKILGACNPPFAHRVLSAAPEVGLLLPCNVTVAANEAGGVDVAIIDPLVMFQVVNNDAVKPIAQAVREKLLRVAANLQG
ncbi:MAG: hypothetical protein HDKAJFGB_00186 [Anaerolineae bacterium]|nr:hypothetical protein [Anaerolineae bacterium]RIK28560.1 MAG: ABC transporter ATP-binding protein [Chloroflexota bacterium]